MKLVKKLNNSACIAIDTNTDIHYCLMGCGLAFNLKVGEYIDCMKIERKFKEERM